MFARYNGREEISPGVWEYSLIPERPLDYIPGQYVDVQILRDFEDRRGHGRIFTLTSLPTEVELKFALKFPDPGSPYKRELQTLQPDEQLRMGDAMGDVVLPKNPAIPLVFIAGGLGIASFVSSLRFLQATEENRAVHLHYGRRTVEDNPYASLTEGFSFATKQVVVSPQRLETASIVASAATDSLVYISGSQNFVEGMRQTLAVNGVEHERIVFDYYDGYIAL